jgi:hypothetical protein
MNYEEEMKIKANFEEQIKKDGEHLKVFADYAMENLVKTPENIEKLSKKPLKDAFEYIKKETEKCIKIKTGVQVVMKDGNEVFGWFREFYEISDLTVAVEPEKPKTVSIFDYM